MDVFLYIMGVEEVILDTNDFAWQAVGQKGQLSRQGHIWGMGPGGGGGENGFSDRCTKSQIERECRHGSFCWGRVSGRQRVVNSIRRMRLRISVKSASQPVLMLQLFPGHVWCRLLSTTLGRGPVSVFLKYVRRFACSHLFNQGSANVNPRDRNDNANRSKLGSRGNPPRPGYSHSRTRSQVCHVYMFRFP